MNKIYAILVWLLFCYPVFADNRTSTGIEVDALPWLTGGYYLSGWYGEKQLKYRAVIANVNVPDSFVDEGFKDKEIQAYAIIVDYFPKADFAGMWYGAGFEIWQTSITNEADNSRAEYDNTVFTVGLGYVWRLSESVYIHPWAALHMIIDGEQDIRVGNKTYQQDTITPSGSIKLGWSF